MFNVIYNHRVSCKRFYITKVLQPEHKVLGSLVLVLVLSYPNPYPNPDPDSNSAGEVNPF